MSTKRRSFLKSLGLVGVGLGLNMSASEAKPAFGSKTNALSAVKISGKILSGGKGVEGVAVTDGINVVITDSKGNYSIDSIATTEFVYISIPRGYEVPVDKGIAKFYQKINQQSGKFKADFELTKASVDDTNHAFIVWADPQVQNEEDVQLLKSQSVPDARKLLEGYGKNTLFHGIGCGDLVWDKFELFEDYKSAVGDLGIPFFQVIGNHDMDIDARTDDLSTQTFKKEFGPTYYSFNRGEIHYVVLDDVFFIGKSKKYIGYISEKQFEWLEQDLALVKPGSTVVVSVHIPVNSGTQKREKMKEEPIGGVVANRKELYRILKPFKAHIMSGHTHFNEKVIEGENIIEHIHGTVCGAWWTGPICKDGTPNGYGVYEVNGSEISWYHKSVGFEKDHQMRIYPVGALKDKPDQFVVNIWNWDPEWKIEWFEDGRAMGELAREVSFDPLSIQLHLGDDKPSKRAWVEPELTDHIFFGKPSPNAQKILVQATDRFMNIYKKEVVLKDLSMVG